MCGERKSIMSKLRRSGIATDKNKNKWRISSEVALEEAERVPMKSEQSSDSGVMRYRAEYWQEMSEWEERNNEATAVRQVVCKGCKMRMSRRGS